jgi:hypothetical protein
MSLIVASVVVAIPVLIALFIRKQLPTRPRLGVAIVVAAAVIGIVAAILFMRYRDQQLDEQRAHRAHDQP